ncbi:hypothetical protein Fmac_010802 [Flemingia macrophylla]|uniref:Uncharacterized protein n=1 Tax=Flemingia macrophylla TaxID=520843 RepID=A0ABD1MKM4_9FABA
MTRPHLGLRHGTIDDLSHLASAPTTARINSPRVASQSWNNNGAVKINGRRLILLETKIGEDVQNAISTWKKAKDVYICIADVAMNFAMAVDPVGAFSISIYADIKNCQKQVKLQEHHCNVIGFCPQGELSYVEVESMLLTCLFEMSSIDPYFNIVTRIEFSFVKNPSCH